MSKLDTLVSISADEKPFIEFESSIDNDHIISGYVPVRSTLQVLDFLKSAVSVQSPEGRAVIAWGSYGTGKSRLCSVLARLFRDGFACDALQPVWNRVEARGESQRIAQLRQVMLPAGRAWRPWLVVPMYAEAGGGTLSAALIRGLVRALRRNGLDDSVLGSTIYHAAAHRLDAILAAGAQFEAPAGSPYSTHEQLHRQLVDLDEDALQQFKAFHSKVTHGVSFEDYVQASGGTSLEAYEIYNTVAERIQQHGFDGILVLWDEFGFAIEELLRGGHSGERRLGQEVMGLQNFVQKSCSSGELGKRVVFLGFTHVGLSEYGSREGLGETDRNRLATVEGRFRNPAIPVRLGMAENEGYHLLAGLIQRSEAGRKLFENPHPNLLRLAESMPDFALWQELSPQTCYDDIVAPCYPMHPATAASLLVLSDQIAQVSRTTFYFLQNRSEGGLSGYISATDVPAKDAIGSVELMRPNQLFRFFEQAIKDGKAELYEQYQEAAALFPNASPLQLDLLRTVLILFVIANPDMSPTTDFLCFCLADHSAVDAGARHVLEALEGLRRANVLWKNEATDVWSFVGRRGVNSEVEDALDQEKELVPHLPAPVLLGKFPDVQSELVDRLGDFPLEPGPSGVVRRMGVRFLDIAQGEQAIEEVNPARLNQGGGIPWRSALLYLVCTENVSQLDTWRERAAALPTSSVYFVLPPTPPELAIDDLRSLIAVRNLLAKTPKDDHAYNVLEGILTSLREKLRSSFQRSFGNEGLRSGTSIVKAGNANTFIPVSSWSELLPSVAKEVDKEFSEQLKVRCGSFNEWKTDSRWAPISNIVERILKFDESPQYQQAFLGFSETSQEAAIIDGVLVENGLLQEDALTQRWQLKSIEDDDVLPVLEHTSKHFKAGGSGRDFRLLYSSLIDAPYGVPNGIMPLLVALVFRTEQARIGVYVKKSGGNLQRVSASGLGDAITDMARHPRKYETRYTRLSGRQRFVFRVVGPLMGVKFEKKFATGEPFYEYCGAVRSALKAWIAELPESVLRLPDLSDNQRALVFLLRGPVPPHISALADGLVSVIADDPEAAEEAVDNGKTLSSFPATEGVWRDFHTRVSRYVEGVKAPVRSVIRDISGAAGETDAAQQVQQALRILPTAGTQDGLKKAGERLSQLTTTTNDPIDNIVSALADRPVANLTEEDYGRAVGVLEVVSRFRNSDGYTVCLPSGESVVIPQCENPEVLGRIVTALEELEKDLSLSPDQLVALVLKAVYCPGGSTSSLVDPTESDDEQDTAEPEDSASESS